MGQLADLAAQVQSDEAAEEVTIGQLVTAVQAFPAEVAAAVEAALLAAGTDSATATTTLQAVDAALQAQKASLVTVLQGLAPPAPPAPPVEPPINPTPPVTDAGSGDTTSNDGTVTGTGVVTDAPVE